MNVMFLFSLNHVLSPNKPLFSLDQIQFGISYISAGLKKNGHKTDLVILSKLFGKKNLSTVDDYIKKFKPKIIGFTSVATEYEFIVSIASYIKLKYPKIFLVIGGPHASLNPNLVIKDNFDAVCVGEGEYPTLELVSQLEKKQKPSGIRNLWFKYKYGKIQKNPTRPFIKSIDDIPFPDRKMWKNWIEFSPVSKLSILLGRGCPFNCTYCSNHALRKIAPGLYVRVREIKNIIKEMDDLSKNFPTITNVHLEIETVGVNKKWTIALAQEVYEWNKKNNYKYLFSVNLRVIPNTDYNEMFRVFKRAGINTLHLGLESGSERIRKKILRRVYSNNDVIRAVKTAKKYKLRVIFFNLIGIPGETLKEFKKTVEINRICQPDDHFTSIFTPYPGTDLYIYCKKMNLLKKQSLNIKMERANAVLNLPGFSRKQIQHAYIWFDYYVYNGRMPTIGILMRVFRNWSNGSPTFSRLLRRLQVLLWKIGLKTKIKQLISLKNNPADLLT